MTGDLNHSLPWCVGCPDHEGCSQGACYLSGGPCHPADRCSSNGCIFCAAPPPKVDVT